MDTQSGFPCLFLLSSLFTIATPVLLLTTLSCSTISRQRVLLPLPVLRERAGVRVYSPSVLYHKISPGKKCYFRLRTANFGAFQSQK